MTALEELQAAVQAVAERARTSVVRIDGGWRGASGVVIADGTVLTNAHNVHGDEVGLTFADGRSVSGRVAAVDADGDLCVIAADTSGAQALEWAPDGTAQVGLPVFAAAATSQDVRVTWGLVSSVSRAFRGPRGRRISGSVEHTAPMASGSSGSALLDREGRLVGLNTNRVGSGFYLAIPTDGALRGRVEALSRGQEPARPRLGIGIAPSWSARRMRRAVGLPERDGLLVREVEADSPAARAGIDVGDLIVSAEGRATPNADDLFDALAGVGDATQIELSIVRGADERAVTISFGG
ncbi:MAG: serine protease Do [Chloroflexota bacterium]|jgi:serine protease Do|nr:serine protease Do [Chloroflexota bacterium]